MALGYVDIYEFQLLHLVFIGHSSSLYSDGAGGLVISEFDNKCVSDPGEYSLPCQSKSAWFVGFSGKSLNIKEYP